MRMLRMGRLDDLGLCCDKCWVWEVDRSGLLSAVNAGAYAL